MKKYNFVHFTNEWQALLLKDGCTYIASFSDRLLRPEVLVFPCGDDGKITDWSETDSGTGYGSIDEFLIEFTNYNPSEK
jgi:hypothetical protein